MTRQTQLQHKYVEFIPEKLETGYLYISRRFKTASHLCCCGCGSKVVTPLNPSKWHLTDHGNSVSLHPSIGNWNFPCRSHYFINHGRIQWAGLMSDRKIANVRRQDRLDAEKYSSKVNPLNRLKGIVKSWFGTK